MASKLVKQKAFLPQYLIPFYKERFVSHYELQNWFRFYNYFQTRDTKSKKSGNFLNIPYCPEENASGVTFVGSGFLSAYLKYMKWLTAKHRLIIELGRSTKSGWYFGELLNEKHYENVNEDQIRTICNNLSGKKIEFYNVTFSNSNFKEMPRESYIESIDLIDFRPPYLSLELKCNAELILVNFIFKFSQLLDCPMQLIDADRYEVEGFTREHCLTKTDIYWPYIMQKKDKYHDTIFELLKPFEQREELLLPTHSRYLLYK